MNSDPAIGDIAFLDGDIDAIARNTGYADGLEYAGFWIRLAATLVDVILLFVITAPLLPSRGRSRQARSLLAIGWRCAGGVEPGSIRQDPTLAGGCGSSRNTPTPTWVLPGLSQRDSRSIARAGAMVASTRKSLASVTSASALAARASCRKGRPRGSRQDCPDPTKIIPRPF
jgi:hypothetical protein